MRLARANTDRWRPWAWAALLLPLGLGAWSLHDVIGAYTPLPFNDHWATVAQYQGVALNGLKLGDLFAQHNEHRLFFPRMIFFADLAWFHGRSVLDFVAIAVIQLLAAAFYVTMADVRTLRPLGVLGLSLAIALTFSLLQWENFFWAFQVQFVGVFMVGAWAIYLFCRGVAGDPPRWGLVLGGIVLLGVATFTMANGLLVGVAMALAALVGRRSLPAALIALAATGALLAIYLYDYHTIADHAPASLALHHPFRYVWYVLTYVGNEWGLMRTNRAAFVGLLGVVATICMANVVFRDGGRDGARTALFGLALFIGLSAALTSFGRLNFGFSQALSSRYTTPTCHFWAAQALFWALTFQNRRAAGGKIALAATLVFGSLLLIPIEWIAHRQIGEPRQRILLGGSAILSGLNDDEALRGVYPDPTIPRVYGPFLRSKRLSVFDAPPSPIAGATFHAATLRPDPSLCRGSFDFLFPDPKAPTAWRADGWSWDGRSGRPFERIVLVDDTGQVLGDALSGMTREDVHKAVHAVTTTQSGWIGALMRGRGRQVTAYGLLADGRACELGRKAWPS